MRTGMTSVHANTRCKQWKFIYQFTNYKIGIFLHGQHVYWKIDIVYNTAHNKNYTKSPIIPCRSFINQWHATNVCMCWVCTLPGDL